MIAKHSECPFYGVLKMSEYIYISQNKDVLFYFAK